MLRQTRRLVLLSLVFLPTAARAEILERIVAKVNGDIVTLSEFQNRQVAAAQSARVSADRVEAFLRENNARILQDAIDELLLIQRADEIGMKVPPDYLKKVIDDIKKENNIATDDDLLEQLRKEGMSLDDLKRNVERSILRRQVVGKEVEPKVTVTDDEARAEYDARKDTDYTKAATVTLQEIYVKAEDGSALDKATAILARARAGEDFGALAREYSAAPSRTSGGDLGRLAYGELNPALAKAAFDLLPGGISDPIPSADGFRILKVAEKTEGSVVPFDQVKLEIRKKLGEARAQKEYQEFLEGLRQKAILDVRVREVPLALTAPLTEGSLAGAAEAAGDTTPSSGPAPGAPANPAGASDEFATTGSAAPEKVAPPALPAAPPPKKPEEKKPEDKKPESPGSPEAGGRASS